MAKIHQKSEEDLVKQWLEWLFEEDSEKPIGPCLSDEEIWDYIEEEIDNEEEKARIEAHILSCPKCLETACRCAEIDHYLNTRKGKKEMKRIGRKLRRIQMELYPDLYLRMRIRKRITTLFTWIRQLF
jgi:hypothetical protein